MIQMKNVNFQYNETPSSSLKDLSLTITVTWLERFKILKACPRERG